MGSSVFMIGLSLGLDGMMSRNENGDGEGRDIRVERLVVVSQSQEFITVITGTHRHTYTLT